MARLDIVQLTKQFGGVTAVDAAQFTVNDNEFMCILGPSGCGKSTLLRMVAGFEAPTSGDIRIDGETIAALPANKRRTAMVFQKYTLWPHMTVYDNIAFGLGLRRLSRSVIEQKVKEALELVSLSGYEARYPAQLHVNVEEARRGQHIGAALITAFARHAEESGAPGVHVVTGRGMRNVGFYLSNGFRELGVHAAAGHELLFLGRALSPARF